MLAQAALLSMARPWMPWPISICPSLTTMCFAKSLSDPIFLASFVSTDNSGMSLAKVARKNHETAPLTYQGPSPSNKYPFYVPSRIWWHSMECASSMHLSEMCPFWSSLRIVVSHISTDVSCQLSQCVGPWAVGETQRGWRLWNFLHVQQPRAKKSAILASVLVDAIRFAWFIDTNWKSQGESMSQ